MWTESLIAGIERVRSLDADVPIGAWTSAFVLDLFGGRQARRAADALVGVGVLAAVPAAATGLSDLADVEHSQQRILGTAHAPGNVTAVALYGGSFLARRRGRRDLGVRLATLGAAVVTGSGFIRGASGLPQGRGGGRDGVPPAARRLDAGARGAGNWPRPSPGARPPTAP